MTAFLGALAILELLALIAGGWYVARWHSLTEARAQAERIELINAAAAERAQLMDRVQSGSIEQYHALQRAYFEAQQEPEVHDWMHDDFGFTAVPRDSRPADDRPEGEAL